MAWGVMGMFSSGAGCEVVKKLSQSQEDILMILVTESCALLPLLSHPLHTTPLLLSF